MTKPVFIQLTRADDLIPVLIAVSWIISIRPASNPSKAWDRGVRCLVSCFSERTEFWVKETFEEVIKIVENAR